MDGILKRFAHRSLRRHKRSQCIFVYWLLLLFCCCFLFGYICFRHANPVHTIFSTYDKVLYMSDLTCHFSLFCDFDHHFANSFFVLCNAALTADLLLALRRFNECFVGHLLLKLQFVKFIAYSQIAVSDFLFNSIHAAAPAFSYLL